MSCTPDNQFRNHPILLQCMVHLWPLGDFQDPLINVSACWEKRYHHLAPKSELLTRCKRNACRPSVSNRVGAYTGMSRSYPRRLKPRCADWQASSPGKHALHTSGLTV